MSESCMTYRSFARTTSSRRDLRLEVVHFPRVDLIDLKWVVLVSHSDCYLIERALQDRVKIMVRKKERHWSKCASYFNSRINSLISGDSHMGWNPAEIHRLMSSLKFIKPVLYFSHQGMRCPQD